MDHALSEGGTTRLYRSARVFLFIIGLLGSLSGSVRRERDGEQYTHYRVVQEEEKYIIIYYIL